MGLYGIILFMNRRELGINEVGLKTLINFLLSLLLLSGCGGKEAEQPFQNIPLPTPTPLTTPIKPQETPQPEPNFLPIELSEEQLRLYEIANNISSYQLPPEVVWAIGQQESSWNHQAVSHYSAVGAKGVFQIANFWIERFSKNMPEEIANEKKRLEEMGYKFSSNKDFLESPEGNAALFGYLFSQALERYNGDLIPALAEYNGGTFMGNWWDEWIKYAKEHNFHPLNFKDLPKEHLDKFFELQNNAIESLEQQLKKEGLNLDSKAKAAEVMRYVVNISANLALHGFNPLQPLQKKGLPPQIEIPPDTSFISYITVFERYTVKEGDTLYKIASEKGVSIDLIVEANNLDDPNLIYAGQELLIPLPIEFPVVYIPYEVEEGDTLSSIAERFGVSTSLILKANPKIENPDKIYPKENIYIPIQIPVYPSKIN